MNTTTTTTTAIGVIAQCPDCEREVLALSCVCAHCGADWPVPELWASPGSCGAYYPYLLDYTLTPCTLAHGHEGDHESESADHGSTRAWTTTTTTTERN